MVPISTILKLYMILPVIVVRLYSIEMVPILTINRNSIEMVPILTILKLYMILPVISCEVVIN